jgi:hypothetical protein
LRKYPLSAFNSPNTDKKLVQGLISSPIDAMSMEANFEPIGQCAGLPAHYQLSVISYQFISYQFISELQSMELSKR